MTFEVESVSENACTLRELRIEDRGDVVRLDALHTSEPKEGYWEGVFRDFLSEEEGRLRVGLAAERDGRFVGYLLGEVRAFEFGSEPCGWVFAVGVDPTELRKGTASSLLQEACRRFREAGIAKVRTMVHKGNVPLLSFFRGSGFVGGSFYQLEMDLEA